MKFDFQDKTNLISLHKERISRRGCRHINMTVDPDRAFVECKDCGEMLDPMSVLCRLATEESRYLFERQALRNWRKKLIEKSRTKCQHCGRMTSVNITMTSAQEHGFEKA